MISAIYVLYLWLAIGFVIALVKVLTDKEIKALPVGYVAVGMILTTCLWPLILWSDATYDEEKRD